MASRTEVVTSDDLDGSENATPVRFSLGGTTYEIDLVETNQKLLADALAPFIDAGRVVGRTHRSSRKRSSDPNSAGKIRAWARENGIDVPQRGRIPASIRDQYAAYDK